MQLKKKLGSFSMKIKWKNLFFYPYSSIASVKRVKKTQNKSQPDLKSTNIVILLKTMALNKYKIEFT